MSDSEEVIRRKAAAFAACSKYGWYTIQGRRGATVFTSMDREGKWRGVYFANTAYEAVEKALKENKPGVFLPTCCEEKKNET